MLIAGFVKLALWWRTNLSFFLERDTLSHPKPPPRGGPPPPGGSLAWTWMTFAVRA
jgi:hypothetical protein